MKNRLQFNRIPRLFETREQATEFLRGYVNPEIHEGFIPLIGEPIVVRYLDENNEKQLILAVGKSVADGNVQYHIIDSALLKEEINDATELAETANEKADNALDLASAATQSVNNYFQILRNMIEAEGIDLDDGSYFDDDDPTKDPSTCGKYKPLENSNYLDDAKNLREADKLLDEAIGGVSDDLDELSAATESLSATSQDYFNSIIEAAGLTSGDPGKYPGHDNTTYITDATSLDNADVLLDAAISELSANTIATISEASNNLSELSAATINLSAGTVAVDAKVDALSANTMAADEALDDKIDELSANTIAADQELADRIEDLEGRKVLGISAITVNTLENGDGRVSLLINEEDDKVLTQNTLGLKANVSLVYSHDDKKIYLKGKNDTIISEVDAKDFIKDGMLSAASVFTATEADHQQYPELVVGKTYIKLLFNVDGEEPGRANPVFISAEDLVDIYSVAPESHTFMEINDYTIKLNVDVEDGLASYNYARNISAVTANIISATGLNMGEQGGYPGHDETHYIKNAGSLDQADVLLDEAIWETSGLVSDISNRLDDLSGVTREFSANTVEALSALSRSVDERIESGLTVISGIVENYVEEMLSGLNFDEIYEYIDSADTALYEYIDNSIENLSGSILECVFDNEEVTAAALNDLNDRIHDLSGATLIGLEELSGSVVNNESAITVLSAIIENNELVAAAAFNDLNGRIIDLSELTEEYYNELNQKIANLSGGGASEEDLEALSASVVTNKNSINTVSGDVIALSASVVTNKNSINTVSGDVIALSASVVTNKNNITNLSAYTKDVDDKVKALSAGTVQGLTYLSGVIEDNELVIAAAFNDLNDRVLELSANTPDMSNYYNKTEVNQIVEDATQRKYQTANTLTNLNFLEFLTIVEINESAVTLSIASTDLPALPANGVAERHVIIKNTGPDDAVVTIAPDSRIKLTVNNLIAIDREGGIGELNALITYDGSAYTIYVITT